jgi:hypothetical protein
MSEPKPIASLSPTLLARKGHAKPAMRPQNYGFSAIGSGFSSQDAFHEDLGWNDMGHHEAQAEPVALHGELPVEPAEPPVVVAQQEMLAAEFSEPEPARAAVASLRQEPARRAAPGSKGKAAFTLRLDGERHLRLRLVCAVKHRSAQQIVTQALDEFLARQPDNDRLVAKN